MECSNKASLLKDQHQTHNRVKKKDKTDSHIHYNRLINDIKKNFQTAQTGDTFINVE